MIPKTTCIQILKPLLPKFPKPKSTLRYYTHKKMTPSLKSDLTITRWKFSPEAISYESKIYNQKVLADESANRYNWWKVSTIHIISCSYKYLIQYIYQDVVGFRAKREKGEYKSPSKAILPIGHDKEIPSRDLTRSIPCRFFYPNDSKADSKGVIMHLHGGGWVMNTEKTTDSLLKRYADETGCTAISVGYRLAPEHPFPRGPEDCFDVGEWLVDNGEEEFGGPLRFIGGESAGAHLSMLTSFHLLRHRPQFTLSGLLLHYGQYDLSAPRSTKPYPVVNATLSARFVEVFLPNKTTPELQDPSISPYYEDLEAWRGKLPDAIFTCGTEDISLADNMVMGVRWMMYGGEDSLVRIYPGALHGFMTKKEEDVEQAGEGMRDTLAFVRERMAAAELKAGVRLGFE